MVTLGRVRVRRRPSCWGVPIGISDPNPDPDPDPDPNPNPDPDTDQVPIGIFDAIIGLLQARAGR